MPPEPLVRQIMQLLNDPRSANQRVVRLRDVQRAADISTLLHLTQSMPCCCWTNDRLCGRGAIMAISVPHRDGTWTLLPICPSCLRQCMRIMDVSETETNT